MSDGLADSGDELPDDPFADTTGPDVDPAAGEQPDGLMGMLRSSEPPVTPGEVGQQLDMAAAWHEHLACGFIKATDSGGTEAWMHLVMAAALLTLQVTGIAEQADDTEQTPDEPQGAADRETFDGPQ